MSTEITHESCQKSWPKVSVIIVNWNGERFLDKCLTALMAQTIKPHEIILIDNASSDRSVEIVQSFPLVKLMIQKNNVGFARGNNIAIEAASADSQWISLLNPDAYAEPRWLEALLEAAESNPRFDIFGSKLINAADPMLLDGTGDAYHVSGLVWRMNHGEYATSSAGNEHEIFSPCGAAALYRHSALQKIGGFDEDYFCYVEDVDLGFRLRLAGYRCLYVPQSVVHHVGSGTTGGQHSDFSLYHGHRNVVWTFVKDVPGILFWLLLPLHMALNLTSIIWFMLQGRGGVIYRAKRDAILGLPRMWRKRQQIQNNRLVSMADIWRQMNKRMIRKNLPSH